MTGRAESDGWVQVLPCTPGWQGGRRVMGWVQVLPCTPGWQGGRRVMGWVQVLPCTPGWRGGRRVMGWVQVLPCTPGWRGGWSSRWSVCRDASGSWLVSGGSRSRAPPGSRSWGSPCCTRAPSVVSRTHLTWLKHARLCYCKTFTSFLTNLPQLFSREN